MRKTLWIWMVFALCMTSCEPNFDEIRDTDQRSVTFHVNLDNFFSDVLVDSNGDFHYEDGTALDDHHRIRITMHCFDDKGDLVEKSTLFSTVGGKPTFSIKHIDKNRQYKFIFLADVVQYNSEIDFYETWYQLMNSHLDQFYLTALDRKALAIENTVRRNVTELYPDNQEMEVILTPVTNNGYIVFVNPDSTSKVSGTVLLYQSMYANTLNGITRVYYPYDIPKQNGHIPTLPVTATSPDNNIVLKVVTQFGSHKDSVIRTFPNTNHKPFVVTVDCHNLDAIDCVYY